MLFCLVFPVPVYSIYYAFIHNGYLSVSITYSFNLSSLEHIFTGFQSVKNRINRKLKWGIPFKTTHSFFIF